MRMWTLVAETDLRPVTPVSIDEVSSTLRFRPSEKVGKQARCFRFDSTVDRTERQTNANAERTQRQYCWVASKNGK